MGCIGVWVAQQASMPRRCGCLCSRCFGLLVSTVLRLLCYPWPPRARRGFSGRPADLGCFGRLVYGLHVSTRRSSRVARVEPVQGGGAPRTRERGGSRSQPQISAWQSSFRFCGGECAYCAHECSSALQCCCMAHLGGLLSHDFALHHLDRRRPASAQS